MTTEATELLNYIKNRESAVNMINGYRRLKPNGVFQAVSVVVATNAFLYQSEYSGGQDVFNYSDLLECTRMILEELANNQFPLR